MIRCLSRPVLRHHQGTVNKVTTPEFSDDVLPPDVTPQTSEIEYPCNFRLPNGSDCGKESGPYGGRGRKPVKCLDHRGAKGISTGTRTSRVTGSNAVLAAQATEALCSIDGMLMLGASIMQFTDTAATIAQADEVFRLRVEAALINSPDTSRKILRYGSKAGDSALLIAILLHVATIAPVFMREVKEKKLKRDAEKLAEQGVE